MTPEPWHENDTSRLELLNREAGHFSHFKHHPADLSTLSNNSVRVIYEDDSGILWIGTREGLNKFDPVTKKFRRYVHSPDDSSSISHNFIYRVFDKPIRKWVNLALFCCIITGTGVEYFLYLG
jgi:ligand-binding sensor domain-containing protein